MLMPCHQQALQSCQIGPAYGELSALGVEGLEVKGFRGQGVWVKGFRGFGVGIEGSGFKV